MTLKGLPSGFIEYVMGVYGGGFTRITDGRGWSDPIVCARGIRQGDPLSPCLFNLVMDWVLQAVPSEVGFELNGAMIPYLAFADDLVLITSSVSGMRLALSRVDAVVRSMGMALSPRKCLALSLVPAGRWHKIKVVTDPLFDINGEPVRQTQVQDAWRYLGVTYTDRGAEGLDANIRVALERLWNAPLKPQQRLLALRSHLLPKFVHGLVLGGASRQSLTKIDIKVRAAVRRWLRLPRDTPVGYFHASCADGGLGVPCLAVLVPGLTLGRLQRLERSGLPAARAAFGSRAVARRLREAREALVRQGLNDDASYPCIRKKWWAEKLFGSNDGGYLRESSKCSSSTNWLSHGSCVMSGRDFVQCVSTHINALPTAVRMSRGRRIDGMPLCRAGCPVPETATHVIQKCHISHGGRILRHDAVVRVLANDFVRLGYVVHVETSINACNRRWRPDIIILKDNNAHVVDVQIVETTPGLDNLHRAKASKYAGVPEVRQAIGEMLGVPGVRVGGTSCTVSWRGVWSAKSAKDLKSLGIRMQTLGSITRRVLKGSYINFSRWRTLLPRV